METPRKNVLAVDDDPAIRILLERALSPRYDVRLASDGREALSLIEQKKPDLLILDLRMPVMDGNELIERLEAQRLELPVVVMTTETRNPMIDSPLVRARHDKLAGLDVLLATCARVIASTTGSSEPGPGAA
jgi:CheY-like chemotaxis protein